MGMVPEKEDAVTGYFSDRVQKSGKRREIMPDEYNFLNRRPRDKVTTV